METPKKERKPRSFNMNISSGALIPGCNMNMNMNLNFNIGTPPPVMPNRRNLPDDGAGVGATSAGTESNPGGRSGPGTSSGDKSGGMAALMGDYAVIDLDEPEQHPG